MLLDLWFLYCYIAPAAAVWSVLSVALSVPAFPSVLRGWTFILVNLLLALVSVPGPRLTTSRFKIEDIQRTSQRPPRLTRIYLSYFGSQIL
jgi:hypothetical protein